MQLLRCLATATKLTRKCLKWYLGALTLLTKFFIFLVCFNRFSPTLWCFLSTFTITFSIFNRVSTIIYLFLITMLLIKLVLGNVHKVSGDVR